MSTINNAMKFLKENKNLKESTNNESVKDKLVNMPLDEAIKYLKDSTGKEFKAVSKNSDTFNGKKVMKLEADDGNYILVIVQTQDEGQPISEVNKVHLTECKIEESLQDNKTIEDPHESEAVKEINKKATGKAKLESLQDDKTIEKPHESEAVKELTSVKFANSEENKGEKPKEMNLGSKSKELNDNDPSLKKAYDSEAIKSLSAAVKKTKLEAKNVKESNETKKLTELRHIEKKVIVKGYDFSELSDNIREGLINKYYREKGIKAPTSIDELVRQTIGKEFTKAATTDLMVTPESYINYLFNDNEDKYDYFTFTVTLPYSELSDQLVPDNETEVALSTAGSIRGYRSLDKKFKERLYDYTNFSELTKSEKREILSKINNKVEQIKSLVDEYSQKYKEELEKRTNTDFDNLQNSEAIEELSKFWYTVRGEKIISKSDAKVVDGEVNESLLKEAPVNLEFDRGFDVYSYDDLDDYGKVNVFNNSRIARNNSYDKEFSRLKQQISDMVTSEIEKVGLKLVDDDRALQVTSYNKGELDTIYLYLDPKSVEEYCKREGIELSTPIRRAYGTVGYTNNNHKPMFQFQVDLDGNEENRYEKEKEIESEIKLDLEGIAKKTDRLEKAFRKEIDDNFKTRLSTDRKYKRREYDRLGNIYRGEE